MNPIILYDNLAENSTLTASGTASNYNVDYLKDGRTFTSWKGNNASSNSIIIDLKSEKFIGAIALAGHNLLEVSGRVKIYKSDNNVNWSLVGSEIIVTSKRVFMKMLSSEPGGSGLDGLQGEALLGLDGEPLLPLEADNYSARYWKITFTTTAAPEIAVLFMGEFIQFEYPPEVPTIPYVEKIVANSSFSNEGHLLGIDVRYHQEETQQRFTNFSRAWYKATLKPFWENYGRWLKQFIYAWDFENRDEDVFYCVLNDSHIIQEPLSSGPFVDEINLDMKILA